METHKQINGRSKLLCECAEKVQNRDAVLKTTECSVLQMSYDTLSPSAQCFSVRCMKTIVRAAWLHKYSVYTRRRADMLLPYCFIFDFMAIRCQQCCKNSLTAEGLKADDTQSARSFSRKVMSFTNKSLPSLVSS